MPVRLFSALWLLTPAACRAEASLPRSLSSAGLDAFYDGARAKAEVPVRAKDAGLDGWIASERGVALSRMLANISPEGGQPGSVAASPSRKEPDYWYNWKRDAALTMNVVVNLYRAESDPARKKLYFKLLLDYAGYTRRAQADPGQAGLGEPKSNMDGTPFTGPWGRPQDDGPAEEASTLIAFAAELLKDGQKDLARRLYGDFSTGIKTDLEYVSHRWQQTSFDLWEEVKAHHFDTAMAQRTALLEGAWLADRLDDPGAAAWYREQVAGLDERLASHWDPVKNIIGSSRDRDGGLDYKASGLDSAVILAAIHRQPIDDAAFPGAEKAAFSVTDKRVLATARALEDAFKTAYAVNQKPDAPGVAIGRYPEDRYYGGNPWVINTNTFAQLHYMAAAEYLRRGAIPIEAEDLAFFRGVLASGTDRAALSAGATVSAGTPLFAHLIAGLKDAGDSFLKVVRAHANPDGSLSEQIDKTSGAMISARDLTWNYASFLSAVKARDALAALR